MKELPDLREVVNGYPIEENADMVVSMLQVKMVYYGDDIIEDIPLDQREPNRNIGLNCEAITGKKI